jgi:preprotein translocase subunit SecD
LAFNVLTVKTITASLGTQQMVMGLLAGGIGLALVVLYCLFYYRALGLVVVASLLVSGGLVYASLVQLGRINGYTLSLAGIAGFIVAIGITADSFVVFFERLKDEVKDGRTVRSAVPRAWIRARRTILSADTVSFLAAAVLYFLAIGDVKGFAFTLGLSTLIDVIVVFLFTHPLVATLARWSAFTSPRVSGLGNLRSDKAIVSASAATRFGAVRTKES